jgi:hypothetical protein
MNAEEGDQVHAGTVACPRHRRYDCRHRGGPMTMTANRASCSQRVAAEIARPGLADAQAQAARAQDDLKRMRDIAGRTDGAASADEDLDRAARDARCGTSPRRRTGAGAPSPGSARAEAGARAPIASPRQWPCSSTRSIGASGRALGRRRPVATASARRSGNAPETCVQPCTHPPQMGASMCPNPTLAAFAWGFPPK